MTQSSRAGYLPAVAPTFDAALRKGVDSLTGGLLQNPLLLLAPTLLLPLILLMP